MKKAISRKLTISLLVLTLGFAPALSYAKNNDNKKVREENKKEQNERKNDQSCLRAFGHLIAPGFIKTHGEVSFLDSCFLPFGISKKFSGVASSTVDTTAPIITNLLVKPNTTKATVTWKTNERSNSTAFWSTSANININNAS